MFSTDAAHRRRRVLLEVGIEKGFAMIWACKGVLPITAPFFQIRVFKEKHMTEIES
jgi:hypothetical protein